MRGIREGMGECYWFNIATRRVETDADPGRRTDRMGPYPTREKAARALVAARARTEAWDSGAVPRWSPPPPVPLTRVDRWVLAHRSGVRVGLIVAAVVILAATVAFLFHGGSAAGMWFPFYLVWMATGGIRSLERRERALLDADR
jgi:hypothetical protein